MLCTCPPWGGFNKSEVSSAQTVVPKSKISKTKRTDLFTFFCFENRGDRTSDRPQKGSVGKGRTALPRRESPCKRTIDSRESSSPEWA